MPFTNKFKSSNKHYKQTLRECNSIYLSYIRGNYHILNSKCKNNSQITLFDKDSSRKSQEPENNKVCFDIVIEGTELKVKKELNVPTTLHDDIFGFAEQFRLIAKSSKWTEETCTN
ncbi:hypothetical protein H311_00447, partial [Anncaliia algerae PRA109]